MESLDIPRHVKLRVVTDAKKSIERPTLQFKDCFKRNATAFYTSTARWEIPEIYIYIFYLKIYIYILPELFVQARE